MTKIKFIALSKSKAARKALRFWYRYCKDQYSLKFFLSRCTWIEDKNEYIIIYRGPVSKRGL